MRKIPRLVLVGILCACVLAGAAAAEEGSLLGLWVLSENEPAEAPAILLETGVIYEAFDVFTDGEKYLVDEAPLDPSAHRYCADCALEDGALRVGARKFVLADGKLLLSVEYDGAETVLAAYTRPQEEAGPDPESESTDRDALRPEDFDGEYIITKYGEYGRFADAEEMGIEGTAVIENRHLVLSWTRNGENRSFEITFDEKLENGCLYTLNHERTLSYIVEFQEDGSLLFTVGLEQAQWVFEKAPAQG